jgi:signal transduction histidine kinase
MLEFFGQDSWYIRFRSYYPLHLIFVASWVIFLVKFVQLRKYSKSLYYLIIGWISLDLIDYPFALVIERTGQYYGQYYTPLRSVFHWVGIEYIGYAAITLSFLLISIIYVSLKDFQTVRWYALAFSVGLISMIISILALFDIPWLPYYPFNNFYFIGSLLEIIILGFVLAERANRHRNQQSQTQQQLIAQLQENLTQKNKLLQIRDEIARDLHDEVGATLTSIAISTKLVQKKVNGQQPDVASILEQIQTDSQDTITAIRDTVWALNPDNDTSEKLFERLRSVAFQLLANQAVDLTFENSVASGTLPPFSMVQRRHIYFVFKEALHNIAKHAQATTVSVHIFREPDSIFIQIADNGPGFEPTLATEGNGLKIIQKRANEGGFSVRVCPQPGEGTAVELLIPLQKTTHIGDGVLF